MLLARVLVEKAVDNLTAIADRIHGRGWKAEVDRRLGHTRGAFRKALNRRNLRLRDFLHALEILGVRASSFFRDIEEDSRDPLDRLFKEIGLSIKTRPRRSVSQLFEGLSLDGSPPDFDSPLLSKIRAIKNTNPREALEVAESTLKLIKVEVLPKTVAFPLLLECASCYRLLDRIEIAFECYCRIYSEAAHQNFQEVISELLLGLPELVVRLTGNYSLSLELADQACLIALNHGSTFHSSRALLVRSRFLACLGENDSAVANLNLALAFMPENQTRYLVAAHQHLAHIHRSREDLPKALYHLKTCFELAKDICESDYLGTLHWTRAEIAVALQDTDEAEFCFNQAIDFFSEISPVSASLVSIEYADHLIGQGQVARAQGVVTGLAALLKPLSRYPVVEAAVMHLIRLTHATNQLNRQSLIRVAELIRKTGQPLRAALSLQD